MSDEGADIISLEERRKKKQEVPTSQPDASGFIHLQISALDGKVNVVVLEDSEEVIEWNSTPKHARRIAGQLIAAARYIEGAIAKAEKKCLTTGKPIDECRCYDHRKKVHWLEWGGRAACGRRRPQLMAENWDKVTCERCKAHRPKTV